MNTRYFKHKLCADEWRIIPGHQIEFKSEFCGEWEDSIYASVEELLEDPNITETDSDGNPLKP